MINGELIVDNFAGGVGTVQPAGATQEQKNTDLPTGPGAAGG